MKTRFYILLSLKTPSGFETYGQYFLGEDKLVAEHIFEALNGSRTIQEDHLLHIDLMETVEEMPVKIKTITCTLNQLAGNCKLIAKELFKLKNLKAYEE